MHSSILAWKIPWTQDPGGLQSMELQRVRYDLVTKQQQYHKYKPGKATGKLTLDDTAHTKAKVTNCVLCKCQAITKNACKIRDPKSSKKKSNNSFLILLI